MARAASYSSAPCGAGKTFQICEKSREITKAGGNVLLIQPTKLLADRTAEDEFKQRTNCPLVCVFHGDTVGRSVGHQLAEYLADPEDGPQVVIATHQVLPLITHVPKGSKWHLMIDECPQIDRCQTHQVMQTHDFITQHIKIDTFNDIYGRIVLTNREAIKRLARNQDDDELWDKLQETARILLNPHWDSFVDEKQYNRLIAGGSGEFDHPFDTETNRDRWLRHRVHGWRQL